MGSIGSRSMAKVAHEYAVPEKTARNDAEFAKEVDKLRREE